MTSYVSNWVDSTSTSTEIAAVIDTLSPGANKRVGVIKQGNMVRFFTYPTA